MDLMTLLIVIIIFGMAFWAIQSVIPMAPAFKTAAVVVLAIFFVIYLLDGWHNGHMRLPNL